MGNESTASASIPNSSHALSGREEVWLLLLLAGVQFTHIMDFMIMMPLGPQLMRLFVITPRDFAFLVSTYQFAAGICGFVAAFFVDRFDRKRSLIFAYIGFALGTFACALAPSYAFLLMARSLAGAFGGVLGAQIMAIIGDAIPFSRRGRAMGIVMAAFSVSSVFGVPFGLYLATKWNWHAPFVFVGSVAAVLAALIVWRVRPITQHMSSGLPRPSPLGLMSGIVHDRNQMRALSLMILLMFTQFTLIPFLSPYLVANVGFREDQLPWMYFVGGGLTIFTSPIVGRLSDRFGKPSVFLIAGLLVILPVLVLTHLGVTPLPLVLSLTALFFVFN
ncbi:MAG: MFS transporter, partial [Bdellovibrionaceae bacterium]|nr:MFS transporter [Pseudobdellovibrionaceae bacterium]